MCSFIGSERCQSGTWAIWNTDKWPHRVTQRVKIHSGHKTLCNMSNYSSLLKDCENVFLFECNLWFSRYRAYKGQNIKLLQLPWKWCQNNLSESEERKVWTASDGSVLSYESNVKVAIDTMANSQFIPLNNYVISIPGHWTRYKVFFFLMVLGSWTIWHHFRENRRYLVFRPLYKYSVYLWPSRACNLRTKKSN